MTQNTFLRNTLLLTVAIFVHGTVHTTSAAEAAPKKNDKKVAARGAAAKKPAAPAPESAPTEVAAAAAPEAKTETPAATANPFSEALGIKGKDDGKSGPLTIKSKTVSLDAKERVFTYRGEVEVIRDDLHITSQVMTGRYDEANRIQTIVCERDVVITRGDGPTGPTLRATSNRAVYNVPKAIIDLTEGPELFRGGNALSADKVRIFVNEDRSEAEGNVQVKVVKADDPTKPKGTR